VLVLRPGALGDTLLAVPALRALRVSRLGGPLTLAAHAGAARLLASAGEVDGGWAFDDARFRWIFGPGEAPDEAVVAWLSGARPPGLSGALVVAPSRPASGAVHCAQYLLDTLAPLGCSGAMDERPLRVSAIDSAEVLIHPGSGSPAKNWPAARFAEVVHGLGDGAPVRLIVGEADTAVGDALEHALGRPLARLANAPLAELAARLAGCRAYLGNDSGVSHLAGLCGARTVALFGPTDPAVWRPLGARVTVLSFDSSPEDVVAALRC
jgi:ADP-heptose:LPS heptosyltransferase